MGNGEPVSKILSRSIGFHGMRTLREIQRSLMILFFMLGIKSLRESGLWLAGETDVR